MMLFMLLFSRQGKLRLQKWYMAYPDKVKKKITRELVTTILARKPKMCSFLEWKDCKIVYKRLYPLSELLGYRSPMVLWQYRFRSLVNLKL
ncbi:AP-1 complex subunit sigma-2-like isoform X1 [Rhagoletis pomonella]|uniref:AP-1 complex subunit sigma-2-like isoform X1 n=1 Tax=Rhagoletis pomonella TaxID=28610 RepID=UPI001784EADA|nr:AP-1 complex subunit sigma-2-like isoform X1 [Rhagoletis pomonella]